MKQLYLLALLLLCLPIMARKNLQNGLPSNRFFIGGRIGMGIPTSIGRSSDEISFKDVASKGLSFKGDILWTTNGVVGIGAEAGFNSNPYKEQFWSSLNYRGSFDVNYRDVNAGVTGRICVGTSSVKPYVGMAIDAHYMMNNLDFESNFEGESVSYTSKQVKPGFAFEAGVCFLVSQNIFISMSGRINIIPNMSEDIVTTKDKYNHQEKKIVVNPHGNQNNIEAILGLHFGNKNKGNKPKH